MTKPKKEDNRATIIFEFWEFLKYRKKWWLGPIVFLLIAMSLLIVMTEGTAVAPFIYTLF